MRNQLSRQLRATLSLDTSRREILVALAVTALLLGFPLFARMSGYDFAIPQATRIIAYALAAASLNIILGYGGMASFGHAAFVGLGGYVAGILSFYQVNGGFIFWAIPATDNFLITLATAAAVASLMGLAIGALSLRTSGVQFIMLTLAFAQMLYFFFASLRTFGGEDGMPIQGRNTFPGLELTNNTVFYYVCLTILASAVLGSRFLMNSRFGMVIKGCRQNERRLIALGISTYFYKLTAFAIAAGVAGIAGALMVNNDRFVSPELMHWTKSGELMVMVILGGSGTLLGPLIGSAVLIGLENTLAVFTDHWMIVLGPVLVLVVLFARNGIWGALVHPHRGGRP